MAGPGDLLSWYNVLYTAAVGVALIYILVTGLFGLGGDHDHDVAHDVGHDLAHDLGPDVAQDLGHDVQHDADGHHDAPGGLAMAALELLGAGRTSMVLTIQIWMISFGAFGWIANLVLSQWLQPAAFFAPGLVLATLASVGFTRGVGGLVARIVPRDESQAISVRDLTGQTAEVLFGVDERGGAVLYRDQYGHVHQLACRTDGGTIARGREVVLTDYVEERDYYLVEALEDLDGPPARLADAAGDDERVRRG